MSTRDETLHALKEMKTSEFLSEYMFDRIPHVFGDSRTSFIHWKDKIAKKLEVDPAALLFVGTSALGVSLRPNSGFKSFDESSDVDVAVISNFHFLVAWRYFRVNGHVRARLNPKMLIAWDEHVHRLIGVASDSVWFL